MTGSLPCSSERAAVVLISVTIVLVLIYQNSLVRSRTLVFPRFRLGQPQANATFKKIAIAHYTTTYGIRTDSNSKVLNENLQQICEILDPEDYALADSVFVSIVDFDRFPRAYRRAHPSQLWIFHAEESPRNSYGTVEMNDITELDDWFNLTATLKPESDFHIQYRVRAHCSLRFDESCLFFLYRATESSQKSDTFSKPSSTLISANRFTHRSKHSTFHRLCT